MGFEMKRLSWIVQREESNLITRVVKSRKSFPIVERQICEDGRMIERCDAESDRRGPEAKECCSL